MAIEDKYLGEGIFTKIKDVINNWRKESKIKRVPCCNNCSYGEKTYISDKKL